MNPKLTLLTICTLSVCFAAKRLGIRASVYLLAYFTALNVFAQNKVVNGGTTVESDKIYESTADQSALRVTNNQTLYSGTNITLSSTFDTGNSRYVAYTTSKGALELSDSRISVSGTTDSAYWVGVYLYDQATAVLRNLQVETNITNGCGYALRASRFSVMEVDGAVITTVNTGGVLAEINSIVDLGGNTVIKVTGDETVSRYMFGIVASGTSVMRGTAMTIDVYGVGRDSVGELYAAQGVKSQYDSLIDLGANSVITTHGLDPLGKGGVGLYVQSGTILGTQVTVRASGQAITAAFAGSVILQDSNLTGAQGGVNLSIFDETVEVDPTAQVILNGGSLTAEQGNIITVSGTDRHVTTEVVFNDTALSAPDGNLLGTNAGDNLALDLTVTLNRADTEQVGGIDLSASTGGTVSVNINGGSGGLNGDLTNSGSATLTVNLNNSALTGDVNNAGDGILTVILDNNSTGSGGYHGGNLITGSDSVWTFNKDSHGNYGKNDGVWNIGDYEVIFDNLTHSGTVNLSVNSDTGAGGSITVTGTADGEGTVHIDTTGNGQADPNQVLPGIVSGDGTEHWQWDPINWGIDTIIKDGDHFIKSGVSPAGAVLNSSVAIQQAMWFAQQNSLLKRMGELRYGARASRPLADKDVRVPYHSLIENIWIRSYGQQLNIGSQVAGKAYEQLIYGVDLGTDHKFTISADSDLYLGVYAGYGRSDIDYRTPGADGEINSYYGGLYATWLHSSGFYLDATVKAASVDNDLKAPYGTTQLTANYSDINLGGSIEIGKKFTFKDDWFIEPQFQVNYLHILAENYAAGPMSISAQDLDALQFRIGSLFGRTINLTNSGALQPYIKISGVETISSGGAIRNGYQHTRANTDGARAELGAGLIWQLDANNQLHLDYEASFGDKYDKPWGLTAGYRHQF